jgi:hypothetical protein
MDRKKVEHSINSIEIASVSEEEKAKNRRNLTVIIDVTMYLAKQGLAFRGKFEFIDVTNPSNTEKTAKMLAIFLN